MKPNLHLIQNEIESLITYSLQGNALESSFNV